MSPRGRGGGGGMVPLFEWIARQFASSHIPKALPARPSHSCARWNSPLQSHLERVLDGIPGTVHGAIETKDIGAVPAPSVPVAGGETEPVLHGLSRDHLVYV